ncbi:MAG TPA: bifunctional (p)ppGpp synthetase/guanosine-3',5'-bis(diphosphate) 3'-pyrophosphohydrolase [Anaerolineae bacterium]|nr:bifunctional (p)ppGpp synthetase/guanosine-3',5'-bis(diphosphate) 3'-pyrophosphohydrolase [Anaerolineae bacterium]
MTKVQDISLGDVLSHLPGGVAGTESRNLVRRAYQFAETAHAGQFRMSGEPYIQHPLYVAYALAELHFDPAVIAAGLLHDVLEDCNVTPEQLRDDFGEEVLTLVNGVTKIKAVERFVSQDSERVRDLQELESLRKLLIAMAEDDIRIIFIKLADRLHNMRTLAALLPKNQLRMARETLEIFAPLASRLGIWVWKAELEDLSFRYLNPTMYYELARLLDSRREERQDGLKKRIQLLNAALAREMISAKIKGRPKHIYSIYRKMRRKNVPFTRVYDAEGLRVIVDTNAQCYQVLGIVHQLWKPVPGEFDDYIAHPKPNGYRSLHTAVVSEEGDALEIQIRTREMDRVAEYGVATHWYYKEPNNVSVDAAMIKHIATIRQSVHELAQEDNDVRVFIDSITSDVFQERVYVFTPKGKVIDLPFGATPLDFAYAVHTEIGHRCRGARVNGRWTPLDYQLRTGERVEIVVGRLGGPSRDWLNDTLGFVKTHRARQKIRQWFSHQSREENISQGRAILDKEIKRLGIVISIEETFQLFSGRYKQEDDFLLAIGVHDLANETLANRLEQYLGEQRRAQEKVDDDQQPSPPPPPPSLDSLSAMVNICGAGDLLTHIAKCCNPLPGEEVVGYVTRGRGVTIHRCDCRNILKMSAEEQVRLIEVNWGVAKQTFPVQVVATAYDRAGLLHDMTGVIADLDINLSGVSLGKRDRYNIVPVYITLEIPSFATLARVLAKLEKIQNVIDVRRISA